MNSIGIYVPENNGGKKIELQINLWNITGDKKQKNAIDIAIRCSKEIQDIYLALPFETMINAFSDLGNKLSENVLKTVFNDNTRVVKEYKESMIKVVQRDNDPNKQFFLRTLSNNCFEEVSSINDKHIGSSLFKIHVGGKINVDEEYENVNDIYVRFRIEISSINSFAYEEEMSNDFIQSNFSSSLLFDFRINDLRAIHDDIISTMNSMDTNYDLCELKKIQFFYMLDKEEEFSCGKMYNSSRLLESAKWHAYFNKIDEERRYLAYYWKEENENTEYSLFFKTNYSKPKYWRIFFYVLYLIFFGALGSLLFSVSQKLCSWIVNDNTDTDTDTWIVCYLLPLGLIIILIIAVGLIYFGVVKIKTFFK